MSWTVTGTEKVPVDKLGIGSVSLLLHGNGANGSTTITDSRGNTLSVVGSNVSISTAESKFGGSSIYFGGTGGYIQCPAQVFNPLSQDFTVEWWQKLATTNTTYSTISTNANGGFRSSNGSLQIFSGGLNNVAATGYSYSLDWQHIAITKTSSDAFLFLDGVRRANNAANTQSVSSCDRFDIGRSNASYPNSFNGYIDELRVTLGIARYTANFTPPTAPFPDI